MFVGFVQPFYLSPSNNHIKKPAKLTREKDVALRHGNPLDELFCIVIVDIQVPFFSGGVNAYSALTIPQKQWVCQTKSIFSNVYYLCSIAHHHLPFNPSL